MPRYVLACDEGTSSARAIAFDKEARPFATAQRAIPSTFPHSGWVEQDAEQIWTTQRAVAEEVAMKCGGWESIDSIGITNQRETTVIWDRATGVPIAPAIVWQCRRTADACAKLAAAGHADDVTACTGLVIDPYFSGTKIGWILDAVPDARKRAEAGELAFGTVDSWLVYQLSGGKAHVIDRTNASRTLLMELHTGTWDESMLSLFGVPRPMLPRIVPSSGIVAVTDGDAFGREVPIAGIAGDQQAALFGQGCFDPGMVKNTYGTGCFALMHTGKKVPRSRHKLLSTAAASTRGSRHFALEGSVFVAGSVVQWLRDELGLIANAAESEQAANAVDDTAGVYLVPAFTGLGAPHWNANARGVMTGLSRGARREHIVRAALESIAYQTRDLVDAMQRDSHSRVKELRVDGGATANDFLMQFQADILGVPVVRPAYPETTALGAAFLAGFETGFWGRSQEFESFWRVEREFEPSMDYKKSEALYEGWQAAVQRTL